MSALALQATKSAMAPGLTASFLANGGATPYTYSVLTGGAGGTIDPTTGIYTGPPQAGNTPLQFYDNIQVEDGLGATATLKILVGLPWMLAWEIIVKVMKLSDQQVWFWNQKQFEPTDAALNPWIVLMLHNPNAFASADHPAGAPVSGGGPGWDITEKTVNISGSLDIHIMSRDLSALNRKEELIMALGGPYSQAQQEANSFYIARIPHSVVDLSGVDGAAIPYHYVISVGIQYGAARTFGSDYFNTFPKPTILVNQ